MVSVTQFIQSEFPSHLLTPAPPQSFSTDGAAELSFSKNGRFMGVAFCLSASVLQGRPLVPHVLCKSCSVRFLLDPLVPPWYPSPPSFTPVAALPAGQRVRSTVAASSRTHSEVRDGVSDWVSMQTRFVLIIRLKCQYLFMHIEIFHL